jgi:hypothetical protein
MEEPVSFACLPADELLLCFQKLCLKGHLSAGVACKSWQAVADGLWRTRCVEKWKLGESWPADHASEKEWKDYYGFRHLVSTPPLFLATSEYHRFGFCFAVGSTGQGSVE